jgi:MYXO-CTERM domain-containing protein
MSSSTLVLGGLTLVVLVLYLMRRRSRLSKDE